MVTEHERIERRNAKLALIYHAFEFGLATIGIGWALYQIRPKKAWTETRRPLR